MEASELYWTFLRRPRESLLSPGKPSSVSKPSSLSLSFSPERWQVLHGALSCLYSNAVMSGMASTRQRGCIICTPSLFFPVLNCWRTSHILSEVSRDLPCDRRCYKPSFFSDTQTPFLMRKIKYKMDKSTYMKLHRSRKRKVNEMIQKSWLTLSHIGYLFIDISKNYFLF